MISLLFLLVCITEVIFAQSDTNALNATQHASLMTVLNATGCSASCFTRFDASAPCPPSNNRINCTNGLVTGLSLNAAGLNGTLSPAIGTLTALTLLAVQFNSLGGTLPTELGRLTALLDL
jgi:hypothetical protein